MKDFENLLVVLIKEFQRFCFYIGDFINCYGQGISEIFTVVMKDLGDNHNSGKS